MSENQNRILEPSYAIAKDAAKILLAPTYEIAESIPAVITVEAEYGSFCKEGTLATLAHHDARSHNPAPCNWPDVPIVEQGDIILISHIDLDTVGGIMAAIGRKPEDDAFWQAAEFIDLHGYHHIHEVPEKEQEKLNAFYAWSESHLPDSKYEELTDVTDLAISAMEVVEGILKERHPQHDALLLAGKEWEQTRTQKSEKCIISDTHPNIRIFDTSLEESNPRCADCYYSPKDNKTKLVTITYTPSKAITVAFFDEGKTANAREIVQSLWGPKAGGHPGIAGSPRNVEMTREDLYNVAVAVGEAIHEPFLEPLQFVPQSLKPSFAEFVQDIVKEEAPKVSPTVDGSVAIQDKETQTQTLEFPDI